MTAAKISSVADILSRPLEPYIFVRKEHFYTISLHGDEDARNNAECNPGTVRVENMRGEQVWPVKVDVVAEVLAPLTADAPPGIVTMETADGWLVIAKATAVGSVVPPYRNVYQHDHFTILAKAEEYFAEYENGEYEHWSPVAIVPCKSGVPLGAKKVL